MSNTYTVPFKPRDYQEPLINFMLNGGKRAFAMWHRRAGKDFTMFNLMVRMATQRIGIYYYFLPTYAQGKKIIWDGMTNEGLRFVDCIPKQFVKNMNSQEMKVLLANGSIIQIIGTDNFDAVRGTNPVGCVFSEYAFQDPRAFSVVSPILRANKGWAIFNSTPNGKNHFYQLSKIARKNEDWFFQKLTWKDTHFLTAEDIQAERDSGILPAMIEQEYNCSFEVGAVGSYYVDQIQKMREDDRISSIPYEPLKKVHVFTDIGKSDSSVFVFAQVHGKSIHVIDHFASNGKDIEDYVLMLRNRGYEYETLWLPHDGEHKKIGMKRTVREQFADAGFKTNYIPKGASGKQEGIQVTRSRFKHIWIDEKRNEDLVLALENYQKEYDPIKKVFKDTPLHDWTSDYADAFRYMCIALDTDKQEGGSNIRSPLFEKKRLNGLKIKGDRFTKPWMKKKSIFR